MVGVSSATCNQQRKLANAGLRTDVFYVKGIHNVKAGVTLQHTFLTENFNFGITDPAFNDPASSTFNPVLAPFDLTRRGSLFPFRGQTDVKQCSAYLQDTITKGNWAFNVGLRADVYRGIVQDWQRQPRVGLAYNVKKTNSVLRLSYSRVLETPFNENLILASLGAANPVITDVIGGQSLQAPIRSGQRNQFNAGFQQAFGKHLVVDADYLWKYTHNAYDFSASRNTPIFFPIPRKRSNIDRPSLPASMPNFPPFPPLASPAHLR